jgi:hypothetical protein
VGVVFLEAVLDVLGLGFDRDPHAHADVVGDLAAVGFQREITSTMPLRSSTPPSLIGRVT